MSYPEIDVAELERRWQDGSFVLDVREPEEWEAGHLAGSLHIPLATIPDRLEELPGDQTVYVVCARGGRSAQAVQFLNANSFAAVNVAGGVVEWTDLGYPLETGF